MSIKQFEKIFIETHKKNELSMQKIKILDQEFKRKIREIKASF